MSNLHSDFGTVQRQQRSTVTEMEVPAVLVKPPLLSAKNREKHDAEAQAETFPEFEQFNGVHEAAKQLAEDLGELNLVQDNVHDNIHDNNENVHENVHSGPALLPEVHTGDLNIFTGTDDLPKDPSEYLGDLGDIPALPAAVYATNNTATTSTTTEEAGAISANNIPQPKMHQYEHEPSRYPVPRQDTISPPKLYHPKPQRLVSASLSEATDLFKNPPPQSAEEPIVTRRITAESDVYNHRQHESILSELAGSALDQAEYSVKGGDDVSADQQQEQQHAPFDHDQSDAATAFTSPYMPTHTTTLLGYNPSGTYYPAPIPTELMLPPLLSKRGSRSKSNAQSVHGMNDLEDNFASSLARRRSRGKSLSKMVMDPPTWHLNTTTTPYSTDFIGDIGLQGDTVRPESPAVSIDSNEATIEDENDYREQLEGFLSEPGAKDGTANANGKKSSSIIKSIFGWKKNSDDDDENNLGAQKEYTQPQHFEQADADANLFVQGGIIASTGGKPMSLLEELEFRKAARTSKAESAYTKLTAGDAGVAGSRMSVYTAKNNNYVHPLDETLRRDNRVSLLELQQQHEHRYKENSQLLNIARNQKYGRGMEYSGGASAEDERATETLAQRRERLKKEKMDLQLRQEELGNQTLKERRQWLKSQKEHENKDQNSNSRTTSMVSANTGHSNSNSDSNGGYAHSVAGAGSDLHGSVDLKNINGIASLVDQA